MGTEHTLIIFLDVESAKEHDCLFSKNTPIDGIGWVDTRTITSSQPISQHDAVSMQFTPNRVS